VKRKYCLTIILIIWASAPYGAAGTWATGSLFYKVASGKTISKTNFDIGLNQVDSCLSKEIRLGDPNYGTSIQDAITTIGSSKVRLHIPPGQIIAEDTTVPINIDLICEPRAFAVSTGKTLTINGGLEVGLYQIFSWYGTGAIKFGDATHRRVTQEIQVAWFGELDETGATDNSPIVQKALDACGGDYTLHSSPPGDVGFTVAFPPGKYLVNDAAPRNNTSIKGSGLGPSQTLLICNSSATHGSIYVHVAAQGTRISGLSFAVAADKAGIYARACASLYIDNCWFNGGTGVDVSNGVDFAIHHSTFDMGTVIGVKVGGEPGYGVNDTNDVAIHNNLFAANMSYCVQLVNGTNISIKDNIFLTYLYNHAYNIYAYGGSIANVNIGGNLSRTMSPYYIQNHIYLAAASSSEGINIYDEVALGDMNYGIQIADNFHNVNISRCRFNFVKVSSTPAYGIIAGGANSTRVSINNNMIEGPFTYSGIFNYSLSGDVSHNLIKATYTDGAASSFITLQGNNCLAAYNQCEAITGVRIYSGIIYGAGDRFHFNKFFGAGNIGAIGDYGTGTEIVTGLARGSFTCANNKDTTVTNALVTTGSRIKIQPTNAAGGTLMGSTKSLYVSAKNAGISFVVTTADASAAAGTETFDYEIIN
jgi:hypothetical protein